MLSDAAQRFVTRDAVAAAAGEEPISSWRDLDRHGPGAHLTLSENADLFLILPATANILSKAAHGAADTLLSTLIVSARCDVAFCPVMNATMWRNPFVRRNVKLIRRLGHICLDNMAALSLADGVVEEGQAPDPQSIFREILLQRQKRR